MQAFTGIDSNSFHVYLYWMLINCRSRQVIINTDETDTCLLQVLRPLSHTSKLDIWSFYRTEALAHGPSYDIDLTQSELREEEDHDEVMTDSLTTAADSSLRRRVVNGCYDNIDLMQPAICSFILSVSWLFIYLVILVICNIYVFHQTAV